MSEKKRIHFEKQISSPIILSAVKKMMDETGEKAQICVYKLLNNGAKHFLKKEVTEKEAVKCLKEISILIKKIT